MPTNNAIRSFPIIPFLLLVGCEQQPKDRAYELACGYHKEYWFNMLDKKLQETVYDEERKRIAEDRVCVQKARFIGSTFIFELDVLEQMTGVATKTQHSCDTDNNYSEEIPMTVTEQTLTFQEPYLPLVVDRKTFKVIEGHGSSCELKEIWR